MPLVEYRQKRHFEKTSEPSGQPGGWEGSNIYVIQKHRATQLHYDFRLEWGGVLLSWAVPKGPSLDPSTKRLAMPTEDHPIEYASFEGVIPEGEYGGGTVMVWDTGTWEAEQPDVNKALEKGDLKFKLFGKKLHGSWVLVRTGGYRGSSKPTWLLIKHRDEYASTSDITEEQPRSAVSQMLLTEIAEIHGGNVTKAATGDPVATEAVVASKKPEIKAKPAPKSQKVLAPRARARSAQSKSKSASKSPATSSKPSQRRKPANRKK